jgi:RNA polymerase sigma-70 factor (ECF subfamily)
VQVSRAEQQAVVERFLAALRTGQLQELMQVMAPDVILVADGGGLVPAARVPIQGSELIAELLTRKDRATAGFEISAVWLNGALAGRLERDGRLVVVSLVVEHGRVTRIYVVANPRKLTRLDELAELVR